MKHLYPFLCAALFAFCLNNLAAQCDNEMACNYDPNGTEACIYNDSNQDLSQGVLIGIPFGQYGLDPAAECAVQPINDQFVQMEANAEGLMQFVIDESVTEYFEWAVNSGSVTQEQADQFLALMTYSTLSFCGDDMSVNLPGLGLVNDSFTNGYWYLGEAVGYYVAPIANASPGCGDPAADNFDICAIPDASLCSFPPVDCNDEMACNYQEGSEGTADCVYFDTDNFTLEENDFIDLYDFDGCETGYAAWNDLPIPLAQDSTGGPLFFVLFDEVEAILNANGFGVLATDVMTVTVSVCGDTMNYNSQVAGDLDLVWDGIGFPNPFYGGYIVPGGSLPNTCSDVNACNFDACAAPFSFESCEYVAQGTIIGDTLLTVGNTYEYTFEAAEEGSAFVFYSACGEVVQDGSNTATLTFDWPDTCEMCVEETTADGCSTITCQTLTNAATDVAELDANNWSFMPNPAQSNINVTWHETPADWVIFDQQGREVRRMRINRGIQSIDISDLANGQYLMGPANGAKQRLSVIR